MFTFNPGQEYIINSAIDWFYHSDRQVFEFDGPPGSGKSVVLYEIIKRLGLDILTEVAPMSFTGAASIVMRMKGLFSAKTAHSWIYNIKPVPLKDKNGNTVYDKLLNVPIMVPKFIPVDYLSDKIKIIVIDEAYSLPLSLRPTIEKFGIKILACGDQNQLPPVNDSPAFLTSSNTLHLTQIMRQVGREDINYIAYRASHNLPLLNGYYGNSLVINSEDLTDNMLLWADCVICGKNRTRDMINSRIRAAKGYKSKLPQYGEKVVCRNNNWLESVKLDNGYEINLCNGLIGTVASNPDVSSYDGTLFSMDFVPDLVPGVSFHTRCNYKHMVSDNDIRVKIRANKWEIGNKFEYAYCITSHIAQGSQFHKVVYIEEPINPSIQNNINLVGATRADTQLIYVKNSFKNTF
jgi:exodeoxyribonuclease-5